MYLSDVDILKELKMGKIRIEPFDKKRLGPASYDLSLSETFYLPRKVRGEVEAREDTNPHKYMRKVKRKEVLLEPGEYCLALTREKITLSSDIIGLLGGRSRFARMGLTVHITSAVVQPGSDNHQILEIVNLSPFDIRLFAGERISQIFFQYLKSPTSQPYRKFGRLARKQ